jgi:rubredoxin
MAKCPHCGKGFSSIKADPVTIRAPGKSWKGIAYCCPSCDAAISVTMDQISLKADTVRETARALGKA